MKAQGAAQLAAAAPAAAVPALGARAGR